MDYNVDFIDKSQTRDSFDVPSQAQVSNACNRVEVVLAFDVAPERNRCGERQERGGDS